MDFGLNEQQEMMRTMARDFLTEEYPEKVLRRVAAGDRETSQELWEKMAGINLMGLSIPEEYDGIGDFTDLTVVLEEMGRACFMGPFFSTVILGASTIMLAGNDKQKQEYLPAVARGEKKITLAIAEKKANYLPDDINLTAEKSGDAFILNGNKFFVPYMEDADAVICAARTSKNKNPGDGISLFLVPASLPGITVKPALMVSGEKAYLVTMDNVRTGGDTLLGKLDEGWPVLEKVLARANVADCAIMVGLAQKAMELTLDYARERIAFGHPIGAFQSIQHRCADMLVAVDGSRFITWQAAWKIAGNQADDKDASVAKAWVSRACKNVMHSAHQIHGAIAFTEDHILHFYIKMARAREFSHGGADHHLKSIINASAILK